MTVKTAAELAAEIASLFADNTSGAITPASLRTVMQDMVDSLPILGGGSGGSGTAPSFTANPSISGSAIVGATLTITRGTATGSPSPTITGTLVWSDDHTHICTTGTTYVPVTGDIGHQLVEIDTASNGVGSPATASSTATSAVSSGGSGTAGQAIGLLLTLTKAS
jgi:hypothetical protein